MITVSGIRNTLWSIVAFGIVAIASTPLPHDQPPPGTQAGQLIPAQSAVGTS